MDFGEPIMKEKGAFPVVYFFPHSRTGVWAQMFNSPDTPAADLWCTYGRAVPAIFI